MCARERGIRSFISAFSGEGGVGRCCREEDVCVCIRYRARRVRDTGVRACVHVHTFSTQTPRRGYTSARKRRIRSFISAFQAKEG